MVFFLSGSHSRAKLLKKKAAAKFLFILVCPESAKWKEEENGLMNIEQVHPH